LNLMIQTEQGDLHDLDNYIFGPQMRILAKGDFGGSRFVNERKRLLAEVTPVGLVEEGLIQSSNPASQKGARDL